MVNSFRKVIGLDDAVILMHHHPIVLLGYFLEKKLNVNKILQQCEIASDVADDDDAKLSYKQYNSLLQLARKELQLPGLGLHFGSMLAPSSSGLIGMSALASENIREMMSIGLRHKKLIDPINDLSVHNAGDYSYIQSFPAIDDSDFARIHTEICFACLYHGLQYVMPNLTQYVSFEFKYEAPDYYQEYYKILNRNVRFNGVKNRIIFDNRTLDRSLPLANKQVVAEAIRLMDIEEEKLDGRIGLISKIRKILQETDSVPSLEYVAEMLHLSISSLKRKMAQHHTNFQSQWDDVRMEKACELLESTQQPVSDIAHAVGFSDAASFRKSFKRWSNETPQDYRTNLFDWVPKLELDDDDRLFEQSEQVQMP